MAAEVVDLPSELVLRYPLLTGDSVSSLKRVLVSVADICPEVEPSSPPQMKVLLAKGLRMIPKVSWLCAERGVTKAQEGCSNCSLTCKCQAEIVSQFLNATFRRVYRAPPNGARW